MSFETDAEKGFAAYLESQGYRTDRARATYRPYQNKDGEKGMAKSSEDFFGAADILGVKSDDYWQVVQVTTGGYEAQRVRKHKLVAIPWPTETHVYLVVASKEQDPANKRCKRWRFERHILLDDRETWRVEEPVFMPLSASKSIKGTKSRAVSGTLESP